MDEMLIRVMVGLVRVNDEFGERSFRKAAHRVLVSIAKSVQFEAEERAAPKTPIEADILKFPLARRLAEEVERDYPSQIGLDRED